MSETRTPKAKPNLFVTAGIATAAALGLWVICGTFAVIIANSPFPVHVTLALGFSWAVAFWIVHRYRSGK